MKTELPLELQSGEIILAGYVGSIAHGMFVPSNEPNSIDDKDVMFISVPDTRYFTGISQWGSRGTKTIKQNEWDIVGYEIRKFISLLAKGNPNVISTLWLDETSYLKRTAAGNLLIENRNVFSSKQIYHSFIGYSHAQLYKMTHLACKGYMGEKRKKLVDKFGYDTKNAAHLIRLMRMCIEFLNEQTFYVKRVHDANNLLGIKRGEWPLETVKEESDRLFQRAADAYDRCTLPSRPDVEVVEGLCMKAVQLAWEGKK